MNNNNKTIFERVSARLIEANEDPAANLLSLLAAPDFRKYKDMLADRLSDQEWAAITLHYDSLYNELKKHEG